VKGQLIPESWSDKDVESIYNSYMKRIWGNHENCVHETGFDIAWSKRQLLLERDEREYVAVLGYD
jgi:hypothetical protein